MEISQGNLARLLISALACGFALAFFGDIVRRLMAAMALPIDPARLSPRLLRLYQTVMPGRRQALVRNDRRPDRSRWTAGRIVRITAQFIYDVFGAILFAVSLLLIFYATNDGRFRLSAVLMMLGGMVLYHTTLNRAVRLLYPAVAVLVQAAMRWIAEGLFWPFRCVWKWTLRPRRVLCSYFLSLRQHVKESLQRCRQRMLDRKNTNGCEEKVDRISSLREQPGGKNIFVAGRHPPL